MTRKMWGGRFRKRPHPAFEYFSSSVAEDWRLASCDLRASKAYARALARSRVLTAAQARRIERGLDGIERDLARYERGFLERRHEDIHSFIEAELARRIGPDAGRLHAGRSRNDQVNTATRLYLKETAAGLLELLEDLQRSILRQAERHPTLVVAGRTHLQKAQPVLLAHQLLSYVESLERSKGRIQDARKRADVLTLGSGALAGTGVPLDREWLRKELGFAALSANSLDAVGSRDFVAEFLFALAQLGTDLSRIAEDLLIAQTDEWGWFTLPEELCTGSSMMPQKRNPDFLELARGAAAEFIGNAVSLLVLLKGLPGSYNRDLQWDKRPLFASAELMSQVLYLFRVLFDGLEVDRRRAEASASSDALCATDLAEHLVAGGMPFREAHERVGKLAAHCADRGIRLSEAPAALVVRLFGARAALRGILDPASSPSRKRGFGSTHPTEVRRQIQTWEKRV